MIEITAKNVKGADLMVTTTVEPTTVKEAVAMLAGIKSGITVTTGKRNRVQTLIITNTVSGRTLTFERDENGVPVKVDEKRPSVKSVTPAKSVGIKSSKSEGNTMVKSVNRIKLQRDVYAHGSGKRIEVVITAAKGGGKVYSVRTFSPEVKHATKGHVIRPGVDVTREVTRHELVNGIVPGLIDANGYRFKSRETIPA